MAKIDIQKEDVLAGLSAVISINVNEPNFDSQAKVKLSGKEVEDAVYSALVKELNKFVNNLSEEEKKIISTKIVNNAKIRQAADVAKIAKKKSVRNASPANLPSNLKDCSWAGGENSDLCELYICEGLSAAGSVVAARNANFQAVLPIRGKILNVMKLDLTKKNQRERFNNNAEINDIIKALNTGVGEHCDIDKSRYGKIMFISDSDVDGLAINVLLLGVFYRLFRPLIEAGMVYQCTSPFFEVKYRQNGSEKTEYAMDEKERMEIESRLKSNNIKYTLARAKGLGELNADVFHDVTMNPKNRTLIRITMKDAKAADDMLELAIGNMPADARKDWMNNHTDVIDDLGLYS